ncbi:hypothetical protein GCM10007416_05390 [Kroppenstedtia guangzhouensis]|uniref:Uncharacterized protein n=1 Tax=Kroppenstedtia guangzhouensis TaxID=1274356 RepID=A0ABQ1G1G3_9BACL|nr:hypothetical protein [Kroppenstedtia guangzhouensis]GGA35486.1 hypothetical protein GCM10007416_05390 [Kroppenstedtia guangzhouensis]
MTERILKHPVLGMLETSVKESVDLIASTRDAAHIHFHPEVEAGRKKAAAILGTP